MDDDSSLDDSGDLPDIGNPYQPPAQPTTNSGGVSNESLLNDHVLSRGLLPNEPADHFEGEVHFSLVSAVHALPPSQWESCRDAAIATLEEPTAILWKPSNFEGEVFTYARGLGKSAKHVSLLHVARNVDGINLVLQIACHMESLEPAERGLPVNWHEYEEVLWHQQQAQGSDDGTY